RPGVGARSEVAGVIDHPYQNGSLIDGKTVGFLSEERAGRAADAVDIIAERDVVEVEREDLFFRKIAFELDGDDPFLQLLYDAADAVVRPFAVEHIQRELLGDGAAA